MKSKLCISALAWSDKEEPGIFELLNEESLEFVELIPHRLFKSAFLSLPFFQSLGLTPVSFQSLLFGTENLHLFQTQEQRDDLFSHLSHVCELAGELGVRSLVFGSPKNRNIDLSQMSREQAHDIAKDFFKRLGDVAALYSTNICLETNPAVYGTNFLTTTAETAAFVKELKHPAVRLNLDLGAMYINQENLKALWPHVSPLIGHIHWSEPQLGPIGKQSAELPKTLFQLIESEKNWHYDGLVSIEMIADPQGAVEAHVTKAIRYAQSFKL